MKKRILFVDDDNNVLQGIKRSLWMRYDNVGADFEDSPENAIEKIDKYDYNIIVTDFKMPGINGEEFLNIVKKKKPGIIRIILTGHIDEALNSGCYNDPRTFFLRKPALIEEIMGAIELAMQDE